MSDNGGRRKNCWEVKECGREPGGRNIDRLGICPASLEARLHGVHGGKNAGRACWIIAGTLCRGEVQGTFARKFQSCERCEFYRAVQEEEFPHFTFTGVLITHLKEK